MAEPARLAAPPLPGALPPVAALREGMLSLAGLLSERPCAEKSHLLPLASAMNRLLRDADLPHGLPHLVLRNFLVDLRRSASLDPRHHAEQLSRAAHHLAVHAPSRDAGRAAPEATPSP